MLKKILALLLVGALLTVGFASCSKKKTGTSAADDPAYQNDDDIIATFWALPSASTLSTRAKVAMISSSFW